MLPFQTGLIIRYLTSFFSRWQARDIHAHHADVVLELPAARKSADFREQAVEERGAWLVHAALDRLLQERHVEKDAVRAFYFVQAVGEEDDLVAGRDVAPGGGVGCIFEDAEHRRISAGRAAEGFHRAFPA